MFLDHHKAGYRLPLSQGDIQKSVNTRWLSILRATVESFTVIIGDQRNIGSSIRCSSKPIIFGSKLPTSVPTTNVPTSIQYLGCFYPEGISKHHHSTRWLSILQETVKSFAVIIGDLFNRGGFIRCLTKLVIFGNKLPKRI